MLALKEKNNDFTFQPINDKIGFVNTDISLPTDSTFVLTLFKEIPEYKIAHPRHETKNHISFGFEGNAKDLSINLISEVSEDFDYKIFKDLKTDTIHYWFKPAVESDSLIFIAKNYDKLDSLHVRIRDLYKDTLKLSVISPRVLTLKDTLKILANTPLVSFDTEKLSVMNKDSVAINASISLDPKFNIATLFFPKTEEQIYTVQLLPGAVTDFFETINDTLIYRVTTKANSEYGSLALTLSNVKQLPIIVQLVSDTFKVLSEKYLLENDPVYFDYITPGLYYVRIVFDENKNGIWDTGNFLQRLAPEKIIYYPSKIEVRANWSLNETFILE